MIKKIYQRFLLLFPLAFLSVYNIQGQINQSETPYSSSEYFQQVITPLHTIETRAIDVPDRDQIKSEIEAGLLPANPFAKAIYLDYDWNNSGSWIDLPGGDRLWMLKLKANDAVSLHIICEEFEIPEGAKLFVYNDNNILGPFTHLNNQKHRKFTTEVLKGDNLTIEYYEPASVRGQGSMKIKRIDYGFQAFDWELAEEDIQKPRLYSSYKVQDGSGTCNINIRCPIAEDWQDHKRAVARVVVVTSQGSGRCSGSLINNGNNDGTPYFQLAWHCEMSPSDVTINYESWQFTFNYEATTCAYNSPETSSNSIIGCTFKTRVPSADYVLVELNNLPSNNNPYFLGWNRGSTAPTSVVGIHHPGGNPKKFSYSNNNVDINPSQISFTGGFEPLVIPAGNLWRFSWASDGGTTEGGSSGSPLLDQNGRSIGVLTGGNSSCSNQQGFNAYGRLFSAWGAVAPFLDPNNIGMTTLNAYDPNAASPNDVGVIQLGTNTSACEFSDNTLMNVTVRNFGTAPQNDVPGSYTIENSNTGAAISTQNIMFSGAFNPGQSRSFTVPVDISEPSIAYRVSFSTDLDTDENSENNERESVFTNVKATVPSSGVTITNADLGNMTLSWTSGNGQQRLVLVKEGSPFTSTDYPEDGASIPAGSFFGTGGRVGDAFAVYRGSANTTNVSGLTVGATYYVAVIEFSCTPPFYLFENIPTANTLVTNLENELALKAISVFPNPANDFVSIDFGNLTFPEAELSLYNSLGMKVVEKDIQNADKTILKVNNLKPGIYTLRIKTSQFTVEKKVVVY